MLPRDRRRGRAEIVYDILDLVAREGAVRKNRIMQLTNLNSRAFKEHVENYLIAVGLLEPIPLRGGHVAYRLTPEGRQLYILLKAADELGAFSDAKPKLARNGPAERVLKEVKRGLDDASIGLDGVVSASIECSGERIPVRFYFRSTALAKLQLGLLLHDYAATHSRLAIVLLPGYNNFREDVDIVYGGSTRVAVVNARDVDEGIGKARARLGCARN